MRPHWREIYSQVMMICRGKVNKRMLMIKLAQFGQSSIMMTLSGMW